MNLAWRGSWIVSGRAKWLSYLAASLLVQRYIHVQTRVPGGVPEREPAEISGLLQVLTTNTHLF